MKRDYSRKGQEVEFDDFGQMVEKGSRPQRPKRNFIKERYYRLDFMGKWARRWKFLGYDMRNNVIAVVLSAMCYSSVFFTVVSYENHHLRIQALAGMPGDGLEPEIRRQAMRISSYAKEEAWNPVENFVSI